MPSVRQLYSGRLIFDHFPKTAGQAINAWLKSVLGDGTVSPNLIGSHRELLRASGEYPIVSGHVIFSDGEGLDPRFQYATLLREPVDRTLSWLYFVTRNHHASAVPELHGPCMTFIESEGEELPEELKGYLPNIAVGHFAAVAGACDRSGVELVDAAFESILKYDCVGTYERLNEFVVDLAALIGIPAPSSLPAVNVTAERPSTTRISKKFKDNICRITELDRMLYDRIAELVEERLVRPRRAPPALSMWARYERPKPTLLRTPALTLHRVRAVHPEPVYSGAILQFELEFELHEPALLLEAGLHILDDRNRWAFGVNNVLLDQPFTNLRVGWYRLVHYVKADLAAGDYTIGFAFADVGGSSQRSLYWHDGLLPIQVRRPLSGLGVGSSVCDTRMMLVQWGQLFSAHNSQLANSPDDPQLAA